MTPRERSRRALERSLRGTAGAAANEVPCSDPVKVARIRDALQRLPPIKRDALLAVRLEDCSYAKIAQQMGVSEAEVEQLLATALSEYFRNLDNPFHHWWRRWLS